MSSDHEEDLFDEENVPSINPYDVLNIAKTASADEVKSAYRKAALKNHPDKVTEEKKAEATKKFQEIALAYAVLSDSKRRAHYDRTGSTSETISSADGFSWSDFYQSQYENTISADAIEAFSNKYKGSEEEADDVLAAYEEAKGDMDGVYERVMLSEVEKDDARFREIINDAIAAGRVEGFTKFTKESAASKKRRLKAAQAEAGEAMELAEELGVKDKLFGKGKNGKGRKDEDDEDALKALIMGRQQARASFIDQLEAKYAVPSKKGKKGRSAKEAPQAEGEPSEEQFQAAAAKLSSQTARGKGRAVKKSPKPEDEEDQPPGRRSKRSRHV